MLYLLRPEKRMSTITEMRRAGARFPAVSTNNKDHILVDISAAV